MPDEAHARLVAAYAETAHTKHVLFSDDDLIRAAAEDQPLSPSQRMAAGYAAIDKENDQ